jgi:hypothetical protein
VKLATHLHLVSRSRMREAIPPLPQYALMAWCSFEEQGQLCLYLIPYEIKQYVLLDSFPNSYDAIS